MIGGSVDGFYDGMVSFFKVLCVMSMGRFTTMEGSAGCAEA
jgi:hypothetical protein